MKAASLIACLLLACAPPSQDAGAAAPSAGEAGVEPAPWDDGDYRRAATDGDAFVAWRVAHEGELPRNRHFELDVWVVRDGVPVEDAELDVRATMPAHGHGMNVEPRAILQPDGSFRVCGMLLHMGGHWELSIRVVEEGRFHGALFDLDL